MAVSTMISKYIQKQNSEQRKILQTLQDLINEAAPKAEETVKWGSPCWMQDGNVCYLAAMKGGYINFGFFRGAEISDPKGFLEGTGKGLRHIKVRSVQDIKANEFKKLVQEAVYVNKN